MTNQTPPCQKRAGSGRVRGFAPLFVGDGKQAKEIQGQQKDVTRGWLQSSLLLLAACSSVPELRPRLFMFRQINTFFSLSFGFGQTDSH